MQGRDGRKGPRYPPPRAARADPVATVATLTLIVAVLTVAGAPPGELVPVLDGAGRYATPLHVGIIFGFVAAVVAAAVAAAAFARIRAANRPAVVGVSPVSVHVDVPGAFVRRCTLEQIVQIAQTLTRAAAAVGSPAGSSPENGVGDVTRSPEPERRGAGTGDGS